MAGSGDEDAIANLKLQEETNDDTGAVDEEDYSYDIDNIDDYRSLLFSKRTDYLIRNNGDQVKAGDAVDGKTVGVYFADGTKECQLFTSILVEAYNEIKSAGGDFEVVFVPKDDVLQRDYDLVYESGEVFLPKDLEAELLTAFSEMPWLAVPFRKLNSFGWWERLFDVFQTYCVPHLSIIDGSSGKIVLGRHSRTPDAVEAVMEYGAKAFPFTEERLKELKEDAKRNQTVTSLLTYASRDFLLKADGTKVLVSELEGKMVAIYFYADYIYYCEEFARILSRVYSELKGRGEPFEVVLIYFQGPEENYKAQTKDMPWLLLPYEDTFGKRLIRYFEEVSFNSLVLLGADGKTINENLQEIVKNYGARAYPFSPERIAEVEREIEEQKLESLLVSDDLDYVVGKDGSEIPVNDLIGKTVLLFFFSVKWRTTSHITPTLVDVYNELKAKQCDVEVIFVSEDEDQSSYDENYSEMPWLALPYGDKRQSSLRQKLCLEFTSTPTLVAIDTSGKKITNDAVELVVEYGAKAFPFTEEHIMKLEKEIEDDVSCNVESITDYKSLLFSESTDYLIRNNGDQVKVRDAVDGKTIGVYFANGEKHCRLFTWTLVEVYNEIKSTGGDFEVVFVPKDADENLLKALSQMPWLVVPFMELKSFKWWESIYEAFDVQGVPYLSIIDGSSGEIVLGSSFMYPIAVEMVLKYGAKAFPFTQERLAELEEMEEDAKRNQTVISVLTSSSRDFLLTADGTKVPVSELEGNMVAIYLYDSDDDNCKKFSQILSRMYSELKGRGEPFEVVLVSFCVEEDDYKAQTKDMPWLLLPFGDTSGPRLIRYFEEASLSSLVLLGADGKTVNENLQEIVKEYGARAYPFSLERIAEADREIGDEQTLESLLVYDDLDYVISKDGSKVPVKDLVGKTVLIFFVSSYLVCNPIVQTLANVYEELRSVGVEVIFVSSNEAYQQLFDECYSEMPWMALPYGDKRHSFLRRRLKHESAYSTTLVVIDPSGRTITNDASSLVSKYGAKAFPFTDEHIEKLKEEEESEEE